MRNATVYLHVINAERTRGSCRVWDVGDGDRVDGVGQCSLGVQKNRRISTYASAAIGVDDGVAAGSRTVEADFGRAGGSLETVPQPPGRGDCERVSVRLRSFRFPEGEQ